MKLTHYWLGLTVLGLACSDDSNAPAHDSGAPRPDGGAESDQRGDAANLDSSVRSGGDAGKACQAPQTLPSSCTQAEYAAYSLCMQAACKTCAATDVCDTSRCKEPSCAKDTAPRDASVDTGGAACSDLTTCCNSVAAIKAVCLMQVSNAQQSAAMSNGAYTADAICDSVHAGYRTQGFCQ